jgi:UDP-glucose 4-epimerase
MSVAVTGKNSFLAKALKAMPESREWVFLSHTDALKRPEKLVHVDVVINCAFSPKMNEMYSADEDVDSHIAKIIGKNAHYIMLSSRMVYGEPEESPVLREDMPARPSNTYGQSKLEIEKSLSGLLGERLTVLRMGNIFGFEPGRKTFFGIALERLRRHDEIVLDISPQSVRDFMSTARFAQAMVKIAAAPEAGVYNLGSGQPISCGDVAGWLIEGYGQGRVIVTGDLKKGQFWLDMNKSRKAYALNVITPEDIKQDCIACGRQLRQT